MRSVRGLPPPTPPRRERQHFVTADGGAGPAPPTGLADLTGGPRGRPRGALPRWQEHSTETVSWGTVTLRKRVRHALPLCGGGAEGREQKHAFALSLMCTQKPWRNKRGSLGGREVIKIGQTGHRNGRKPCVHMSCLYLYLQHTGSTSALHVAYVVINIYTHLF